MTVDIGLPLAGIRADVLVTAAATNVQMSQIGVSATVLDAAAIDALGNTDLLEPLRSVPGVAVVQTGARGGPTSLFVRGGSSNFNKVLVDGVPANDIGGAFDFADLSTSGVDNVEVLRGSNSVLYGSDAMTSVINIATRRGTTRVPEARFSIDGGNFGTSHEDVSVGGAAQRVDYFAGYAHLSTDNDVPNNDYRNDTFASRVGVAVGAKTQLTGTFRLIDTDSAARIPWTSSGFLTIPGHQDDDVYLGGRANPNQRSLAEHDSLWRVGSGLSHGESVADRHAVRFVRVCQFSWQHRHDQRRQRLFRHREGDPGLRRFVSVALRRHCASQSPVRADQLPDLVRRWISTAARDSSTRRARRSHRSRTTRRRATTTARLRRPARQLASTCS